MIGCVERGMIRMKWLNGRGEYVEDFDLLPCPKCKSVALEVFANVVECMDCDHRGPSQPGPELYDDWRLAIIDWNLDWASALLSSARPGRLALTQDTGADHEH